MAGFSDMPPEVRNIMYEQLLAGENRPRLRVDNELAMLTLSKQLHNEASSYFYQNNELAIDAPAQNSEAATILPPIADKYLRYLRHLTLYTLTGHPDLLRTRQVAKTISSLANIGADFDALNIFITSPLSHLLSSRVDDSVLDADHPITVALRYVLQAGVTKLIRIELKNAWFAPGIARSLASSSSQIEFFTDGALTQDLSLLERPLTGRYSSTHLTGFGLSQEHVVNTHDIASSPLSSPSSLPSSLCSAFAGLDTFSVTSFEYSSDEVDVPDSDFDDSTHAAEQPFFTEDDIEEWSASTEEVEQEQGSLEEMDDLDGDEEMEGIEHDEVQGILHSMEEAAHDAANGEDITYMANFAPDLLLSRHHLGHLAYESLLGIPN
jgi:hypothetical protein